MAVRKTYRRKHSKHQIGDLRDRVELLNTTLRPSGFNKAGAKHRFTVVASIWAKVETTEFAGSGERIFKGVNIATNASHVLTIRSRDDVDSQNFIRWKGENYRIEKVTPQEERDEFMQLFCLLEGDVNKLAAT